MPKFLLDPTKDPRHSPATRLELHRLHEASRQKDGKPIQIMTADQWHSYKHERDKNARLHYEQTLSKNSRQVYSRYKALNWVKTTFLEKILATRLDEINMPTAEKNTALLSLTTGLPNNLSLLLMKKIMDQYHL